MQFESEIRESIVGMFSDLLDTRLWSVDQLNGPIAVSGCVHIAGSHPGVVVVCATTPIARSLAGSMLGAPLDELTDDDLRDAFAELTNILGGNVKGMLDGENQLSVPTVALAQIHVPTSSLMARCTFADKLGGSILFAMYENVASDKQLAAAE